MKKSLIPMGIAGLLALGATFSSLSYVPATVTLEGAGGTDMRTATPQDAGVVMLAAAAKNGDYYGSLEGLPDDPEPVPGELNSLGIEVSGFHVMTDDDGKNFQRIDRSMVVAQNEKSVVYHIDAVQQQRSESNGDWVQQDINQNVVIAVSRHGMYVKYNYFSSETTTNVKDTGAIDPSTEIVKAIPERIMAARGKWIYVGIDPKRAEEASSLDPSAMASMTSKEAAEYYIDAMALALSAQVAQSYRSNFLSTLNDNANTLAQIGSALASADWNKDGDFYTYSMSGTMSCDLSNRAKPVVSFKHRSGYNNYSTNEEEKIVLSHINNEAVPVIGKGELDFYDLIGGAVRDVMNKYMSEGSF